MNNKQHSQTQKAFSLQIEEEMPQIQQRIVPKGAKFSKNIGRFTPTSCGPNSYSKFNSQGQLKYNENQWDKFETKQHHLHKTFEQYVSEKEKQLQKQDEEQINQQKKIQELQRVIEDIKSEKFKIKLCLLCRRKFANTSHLERHQKNSELHQQNQKKFKQY